jgi:predicted nucleic acid-binding protein
MARYVLDTNQVVAAGSGWLDYGPPTPDPIAARRLLIHVAKNETGLYCGKIAGEYLEKLLDQGHPPDRASRLIRYLVGAFERVSIETEAAPHAPTDPDDEIFVLCALDGNAHYLVSEDNALLALRPHYQPLVICGADEETARLGI